MSGSAGAQAGSRPTHPQEAIAVLLPEPGRPLHQFVVPAFESKLRALGYDTSTLIYYDAGGDPARQLAQAEAAITQGAKVLVIDPIPGEQAALIADKAGAAGVAVISHDRLIQGSAKVSYHVAYDQEAVGGALASSLVDRLKRLHLLHGAEVVMINGDMSDPNAVLFRSTAHAVFDRLERRGALTIAAEYETPEWQPSHAYAEMREALALLGNQVDGVYAANDGLAGGAIEAMKAAGLDPLPPVTGQDAELSAIQRILVGDQYMTVYKPLKPLAEAAAVLAFNLATGRKPPSTVSRATVNNGAIDVPAWLFTPVVVTRDNIAGTVVEDGFWTVSEICTPEYVAACAAAGVVAEGVPAGVAADGKLTIGTDPSYPPAESLGTDGTTVIGFDVDLFDAVAAALGLQAEWVPTPFGAIFPAVTSGEVELGVSAVTINTQREALANLVSYFNAGTQWATQAGNPAGIDPDDACGKRVGVQAGTLQVDDLTARSTACAAAGKPSIQIDQYPSQDQATGAVVSGLDDATLSDSPVIAYAVAQSGGQLELLGDLYDTAPYGAVVSKDQAEFADAIATAVKATMVSGAYTAALNLWGVELGALTPDEVAVNP